MIRLVCTILLLVVSSSAIRADSTEPPQGEEEPMLSRADIVTLSKIRHSLHNMVDQKEQCSQFLQRANDNLNPPGPDQVNPMELLREISHELRVRQWPFGNVGLADYFDLCLEKAPNAVSNVKVEQTSPNSKTTTTTKSSSTGANSKVRVVNGQVVENTVETAPQAAGSGPAVAVATSVVSGGPSGSTAVTSTFGGSAAAQASTFVQSSSGSQPPAVQSNYKPVPVPQVNKIQPTPAPSDAKYQQTAPAVAPASSQVGATVDPMAQLVAENEALKRQLAQVDPELRSLKEKLAQAEVQARELVDFREQLSKLGVRGDPRTFAADYASCKKSVDGWKLEVSRLQDKVAAMEAARPEVSNADLLRCQEELEDARALSDNYLLELDGAKQQFEVCNNQLHNHKSLSGDNAKIKQELAKLEALVKQQQADKVQCRKEQTAAIQAKVQAELERSKCDGELAELQARLQNGNNELNRDPSYDVASDNGSGTIEVEYTGDQYTNDDVSDDEDIMTGPARPVPVTRIHGKKLDITDGRSNPVPGAYASATATTGFLGGNDWRSQQAAQMAKFQQSRQQYYPAPASNGYAYW